MSDGDPTADDGQQPDGPPAPPQAHPGGRPDDVDRPRATHGARRSRRVALVVVGLLTLVGMSVAATLALTGGTADVADPTPVAEPENPALAAQPPPDEREPLSAQQLAARYGDAVWRVEADGCGILSEGTAFAIDRRILVTNWHVTVTDSTPELISRDGSTRLTGTVIGWSQHPDLALIEVDRDLPEVLEFVSAADLQEGDQLTAIGYPVPAGDFSVTSASIVSFQIAHGQREAIRADGTLDKGNSGGPALTSTGQVAGVVTEMVESGGFQLIPLLYTFDYLDATIQEILEDRPGAVSECDDLGQRPSIPNEWDWQAAPEPGAGTYGDDPYFDALWEGCADGDWGACDELYWDSPLYSDYEQYGATCGDRGAWIGGWCVDEMHVEPDGYGDDASFDQLWDGCSSGGWEACDELYWNSPIDSRYEQYGATCGDRVAWIGGSCTVALE